MFSGIGAPEEALRQMAVEHEIQFACDCDSRARDSYLNNFSPKAFFRNIRELPQGLYNIDLLVFGFPCQPFSLAGRRTGLEDPRGQLVFDAIDILNKTQPLYFIAENVKGLTKQDSGKCLRKILRLFRRSGYKVRYKVLNLLDFGIPQHRERLWIVGIRKDQKRNFKFPNNRISFIPLKKILDKKANKVFYASKSLLSKDKVQKRLKNYNNEYINCITQTIARNGSSSEYVSYIAAINKAVGQKRKPTPEECLRLFGFSSKFKFPQSSSLTSKYNQLGNTMPVPVLKSILRKLYGICSD